MLGFGFSLTDQNKITAAVVTPWYLSGGVDPSDCIAAYQAKGAESYAASKVNLANPGIHDLTDNNTVPWDSTDGWKSGTTGNYLVTDFSFIDLGNENCSAVMLYSAWTNANLNRAPFGADYTDDEDYLHNTAFEVRRIGIPVYTNAPELGVGTNVYGKLYTERSGVILPANGVVFLCNNGDLYIDGLLAGSPSKDESVIPSGNSGEPNFYICNVHLKDFYDDKSLYGIPGTEANINILAIAFYKAIPTALQVSAITTAMQAL